MHTVTRAQQAVGAASKVTSKHSVEDLCALLERAQLGHCVPAIAKNKVNGRELLACTQSEFIHLLTDGGMLPFKARAAWDQLQPCLKPVSGHVCSHSLIHILTRPSTHTCTDACIHPTYQGTIINVLKANPDLIRTRVHALTTIMTICYLFRSKPA